MLSESQLAVIKQTVPILQEHGETLTRHFYQRMFRENPEVLAFFNPAHQHAGTQQRALAGAICAYAQHIETPELLADAVELIAQKHASLQILAEHYPIVGANLLAAIQEVLGEGATDAVIDAWGAAYGVLADILIAREGQIYADQQKTHGWNGFRRFVVARREPASDNIVSFYLRPEDGEPLHAALPGQYLTLRVAPDGSEPVMRNYSLSGQPDPDLYRISVKKEAGNGAGQPAGVVSAYLHEQIGEGDVVELAPPCGEFTLQPAPAGEVPLVLIAGGVGITPLLAMLHGALAQQAGREVILIQCARNSAERPFVEELNSLQGMHDNLRCHVRLSEASEEDEGFDSEGFVDGELLDELVGNRRAQYYFCGPAPMMRIVNQLLVGRGVDAADIHFEFFGPKEEMAA
ncbi:NO-inducible flavohemoprotein [Alcanivorax sp. S6407]|uniref:NO-inducible flavohemoprotein n=1 Tax=Alcanivorax sp. S6407 TaxID=2926424 RepID=UPI001FF2C629|nr:NO-inducible flavohemoprotein [Alcanivorax sp. S6407]MCK0153444.1 NO-inducible flavohemoprotein [Alcanivorax sp. S6407]